jgi:drug/metabolite transporter (DMT)-like permease
VSTLFAQLKILTTAICSNLILGRRYSSRKWVCLLVLMAGVTCVSLPLLSEVVEHHRDADAVHTAPEDHRALEQKVLGLLCLVIQISISGFASVYFELVLKDRQEVATIWERNFQLAFYSVLFTLMVVFVRNSCQALSLSLPWDPPSDSSAPSSLLLPGGGSQRMDIFAGWTGLAVATSLLMGGAGLCVAGTLKVSAQLIAIAISIAPLGHSSL